MALNAFSSTPSFYSCEQKKSCNPSAVHSVWVGALSELPSHWKFRELYRGTMERDRKKSGGKKKKFRFRLHPCWESNPESFD